jgi:hypothetical protein
MSDVLGFLRRGPISPRVHGTVDYPFAAVLLGGPRVLDFQDDAARVFVWAVGGAATVLAVGTAWSRGIVRVVPPVVHGVADLGATIALIAAPFALGFNRDRRATAFCVGVGAGGIAVTLLTRFESDLGSAAPADREQAAA